MNPTRSLPDFRGVLADPAAAFLTHKRALGRRFATEEKVLHLLEHYLDMQPIEAIDGITPAVLDAFLASRPRRSARSYNHLLGVLRRFFDWLVVQQMIPHSPLISRPRRATAQHSPFIFDVDQARRLLEAAARLPSRPDAPDRGATYRVIFALLYALGLRVGEVSRLCIQDNRPSAQFADHPANQVLEDATGAFRSAHRCRLVRSSAPKPSPPWPLVSRAAGVFLLPGRGAPH